jgi:choline dehydrogenase-like flavoprotein
LQRRHPSEALRLLGRVPAALPELADLAFWRLARHRLVMPKHGPLFLHVDMQQTPDVQNRIYLCHGRDSEGHRRIRIDWNVSGDIEHCVGVFEGHLRRFWDGNRLTRSAILEFLPRPKEPALAASNAYDIYHPAGTTRMAADRESGCVDRDLLLFGTDNVFIASTSVFPALGAANPTYTAMALGIRLADHLARGTA